MVKHYNITIIGRVQGVGFRYSARSIARIIGVCGFVKNTYDRAVYIEVEGETDKLEELLRWCHQGPDHAKVQQVMVTESDVKGFVAFEIIA